MAGVGGAGASGGQIIGVLLGELNAYVRSRFISQKFVTFLAALNQQDLTVLSYKLSEVPDALRYLEGGHARGKVVITVD